MARIEALIVDDHEALVENLVDILKDGLEGYDVACRVASNGADALALADPELDLAVLDLHLPDSQGTTLIDGLKARSPHVQVVIITGDTAIESAIEAIQRGAFGYVLKPFKAVEVVDVARRAVEKARLLKDREALQLELAQSEARHRHLLQKLPVFVMVFDATDQIVFWNRRLEEVTGYARDEMLGRPARGFVSPGDSDLRLPMKDGGHRLVRWVLSEDRSVQDGQALTVAVGSDVTDEREAQRRARRAERLAAVGTLAAGLAHEVRNPLNSASLQLEVLERRLARRECDPEALGGIVKIVHGEIVRLDHLVSDFLAFARPSPLAVGPVQINDLVLRVANLLGPECARASVELVTELDADAGVLQADEQRLMQVFLNVLRNALEAVGEVGTIVLRTRAADARGDVRIEIEDDGPGFSDDAPIFDAFYTTKPQGTGLGLAIVHRIIADHGGSVGVESRPGCTRFTLLLPQPGAPARSKAAPAAPADPQP